MATAFTLTLAYLGEHPSAAKPPARSPPTSPATSPAISSGGSSRRQWPIIRAGMEFLFLRSAQSRRRRAGLFHRRPGAARALLRANHGARRWRLGAALRNPRLRAAFGIGFCILFAFIGTFTYVNFVSGARAFHGGADGARFHLFRIPAIDHHDAAGRPRGRVASAPADHSGPSLGAGRRLALPLIAHAELCTPVLIGMVLVGVGTFFAQATATGFVGRAATADRGSASGIYLACYFLGGMIGSAVLGRSSIGSAGRPALPGSRVSQSWQRRPDVLADQRQ